jgi:hypothetical protein
MKKLRLNQLRRENKNAMRKYERYGIARFTDALREQAKFPMDEQPMINAYVDYYTFVFLDAATREFNRIRVTNQKEFIPDGFFLATWRAWIGNWVFTNLGEQIKNVNNTTLKFIKEVLAEGIEQGLQPFQMAKQIQAKIVNKARALAIARTEGTRANAMGKERSARDWATETGQTLWKIWVHGGSAEARQDHIEMQNKPYRANQLFPVGGGMDKPGDPRGGAEQVINCSCTVVYVSQDYVNEYFPEAL